MQQHRKIRLFGLCTLLTIGIVGCGTNDEAANRGVTQENNTMKIGYYSNENHDRHGGNVRVLDGNDNDGPVTELMDHGLGAERTTTSDRDPTHGANLQFEYPFMGQDDRNYHGHLSAHQHPAGQKTYKQENEGNESEAITRRVNEVAHVKEAQTIIDGDNIVIGVLLHDPNKANEAVTNVQRIVQPYVGEKSVKIVTNESQFNRIKVMNNDLKNGGPRKELRKELDNIMNSDQQSR